MKIPKYLFNTLTNWTYYYGIKRAIKVINIQASIHKKAGRYEQHDALTEVSKALQLVANKNNQVPEGVTLKWPPID